MKEIALSQPPEATHAGWLASRNWDEIIARAVLACVLAALFLFLLAPMCAILANAVLDHDGHFVGLAHFAAYIKTPALMQSARNSVMLAGSVVGISVPLAFVFAYALTRSTLPAPLKAVFRLVALIPLLAPSLLSAISFVQWFGNQGVLKPLLGGASIYGAPGIIIAEVYNTFPHALMILVTALSLADGRLYEAASALGASTSRKFFTVTLPSCKYGLISAATVTFTYVISDFGAPKVIGGDFNVLSIDVFKQVIGQHNFSMGAVVGMLLLIPSVLSFMIDTVVRRKLRAQLTARSVPYAPKPNAWVNALLGGYCALICALLLAVVGMAVYTSLIKLWPYDLTLGLQNYRIVLFESDMAGAYKNSLVLAGVTALSGSLIVFTGAYLIEKTRNLGLMRPVMHFLAVLSMAVPGLVLGLGYVIFFNHPANPLNFLYNTMILVIQSTIIHYYTSSHLTAITALKQIDNEFEAVSASLKVPQWRTFLRVTLPVCLPAVLDIARYYFVVSMATLSCVIFLYTPETILASVAIMHMDDAGDIGPAAALASLIVLTSTAICLVYALCTRVLLRRTQAWRDLARR
ncbi:putative 2-aminoethylphosphonate ABC transporter permease subunit [Cupriavidus taiwanensis]|uniref:putative 2-aminoethylphosphonate ABC transporter permease subunit n=1 Tax=Cupriavidus taiwanensis TaxID=164546 RepID=UPI000E102B1A|nr:putative 2-aminoethylphosphonate ABC transporter permease subunit [Cupriavidus taiwanensis]SOY66598.1 Binding-protein-dependent transport systems inner membrane component [Cupriavidus taiwanensis]SOY66676.1 Binding-protein-dependent transport systems inner membrane component [Cupriavidus taiwanensis]SOY94705.1 Binding-protein-dependent transport systems inner membrane component [Cupriavidus taiwanensis]SOZ71475.1 Binding-protein-dependent transport systems inner membrane component [Cupriavid